MLDASSKQIKPLTNLLTDRRLISKFGALIDNEAVLCERYFADDVEINAK